MKVLNDETLTKLKTKTKLADNKLQGVPCYDILAN